MRITPAQTKKLWAAARQAGLDRDEVYDLVEAESGGRSVSALTLDQAARVIDRVTGHRPAEDQAKRRGRATPAQVRLIKHLAVTELGWDDPKRLAGFLERMARTRYVNDLTAYQASTIIEALKAMAGREAAAQPSA